LRSSFCACERACVEEPGRIPGDLTLRA